MENEDMRSDGYEHWILESKILIAKFFILIVEYLLIFNKTNYVPAWKDDLHKVFLVVHF